MAEFSASGNWMHPDTFVALTEIVIGTGDGGSLPEVR